MLIELQNEYLQEVLDILLQDKNTNKNIIWATNDYIKYGFEYSSNSEMTTLTVNNVRCLEDLQPRVSKSKSVQKGRTKEKAEVFTPAEICDYMNSYCDFNWFDIKTKDKEGKVKFVFSKKKSLKSYINLKKLEITCGEAPFVVSRYDTTTGKMIPLYKRIGFLDRKLLAISSHIEDITKEDDDKSEKIKKEEWLKMVYKAYDSCYGYEYQGDNLLKARINLFYTFTDYYEKKWGVYPPINSMKKIATIISKNFWQMDGLTYTVPNTDIECKLFKSGKKIMSLKGEGSMKFDYIIGNPPYQIESEGTKALAPSIYNYFMDGAYDIGDKVILITPARFLFNTGNTSKEWNQKMLNSEHLSVLLYEVSSKKIFPNTDIKGGVVITYYDKTKTVKPIGVYVADPILRSILSKVQKLNEDSIVKEICTSSKWNLEGLYSEHPDYRKYIKDNGNHSQMDAAAFSKVPVFFENKPEDNEKYVQLYGRYNDNRVYRYVKEKYIKDSGNLYKYKVFVPKANGSGAIGEVLSTPVIGTPVIGSTQTFLAVGKLESRAEAEALLKYLKGKFARIMLGTLKVTQNNPPSVWENVPNQNFTENSDINWSVSIAEIDKQLYKKYGLDEKEIAFIEEKVKEME